MFSVIIVAAGDSTRFSGGNKMVVKLENQELVINETCKLFLENNKISKVILVSKDQIKEIVFKRFVNNSKMVFTQGGSTRFLSVKNGLEICDTEKVLIHDGARPFLSQKLLDKILYEIESSEYDAVIPWIPVTNTLKKIKPKIKTVKREEFVQTQTPQAFNTKMLKKIYENLDDGEFYDDCQVLEEHKKDAKIKLVEGEITNKKITFIQDLSINT
ncbi:IspD/TarI family cytidylyltransferase [Spiroplasma alleghenense]|uniref:2-C-methyl-D-erythritol 4-phosphate cytidylyltransferase n=1 Tax=Spiroplasma alleghenense TaxID=216931 RepID=A0A345Z267_9MOLU|nr:IspD/TarI family cytidylyltransferase [Spiroplasma alleghenense]AXK50696.1 2-C-methyl-D-erythritol 4-phosphate cytidylyltransferase [Spiroplasma alleghenense]